MFIVDQYQDLLSRDFIKASVGSGLWLGSGIWPVDDFYVWCGL